MNIKPQSPANKALSKSTKSQRVHNTAHHSEVCADLQKVIDAWPDLPEHVRAAIRALVKTAIVNES